MLNPALLAPICSEHCVHPPVIVPSFRHSLRHALPNVIEGKLVPFVLFVGLLQIASTRWALVVSLAWSIGSLLVRRLTDRPTPGIVVLSALTLGARTVVALATGSLFVYFLQPTLTTAVIGVAFLISVPLGAPLAQKLAFDLLPFDADTKTHPLVRAFFVRMSLLWAVTSMINAALTCWLLVSSSPTTFVMVKSVMGPGTAAVTIGVMLVWLKLAVARTGTSLVWSPRSC
jgi:hypothetical protein